VLLIGGGIAALVLSGGSGDPQPAADRAAAAPPETAPTAAPPASDAKLRRQVQALDGLMRASVRGRAAAVKGDTKAAIANRAKLLADLRRLSAEATDAQLKGGLRSFTAAIRESLRQNSECGERCTASELNQVNRLKQQTLAKLNPLLRRYARTSYRSRDI
jgi:hypothetical protein